MGVRKRLLDETMQDERRRNTIIIKCTINYYMSVRRVQRCIEHD